MNSKRLLRKITLITLFLSMSSFLSSCSEEDYPTTGILRISFSNGNTGWSNHLYIGISPFEQESKIIKSIEVGNNRINDVELNPGNYNVYIRADNNNVTPYINEYVQVQSGKTVVLNINEK